MKQRRSTYPLLAAAAALLALASAACGEDPPDPPMNLEIADYKPDYPSITYNDTSLFVDFETTKGNFTAILFDDLAPNIVDNFVGLARDEFYDGLTFHRVVPEFVIQGGDPAGNGSGGPGYQVDDEFHPAALHDSAGILSMANSGFNTNGSQFFVTLGQTPHLDAYNPDGTQKNCPQANVSCHAVFGRIVEGLDVVFSIEMGDVMSTVSIREVEAQPALSSTVDGQNLAISNSGLLSNIQYYAAFETDRGNFRVQLRHDEAPRSVAHFVELARRGFYNGTTLLNAPYPELISQTFLRPTQLRIPVEPGNPQGAQVTLQNDYSTALRHDSPGVLSFLSLGPNLSAGLFHITQEPTPQLDAYNSEGNIKNCTGESVEELCYAVFGKVSEGLDVITGLGSDERIIITRVIIQQDAP